MLIPVLKLTKIGELLGIYLIKIAPPFPITFAYLNRIFNDTHFFLLKKIL